MTKKRIIPCLDVRDGRVVKGIRFAALRDAGDPAEAAARYDQAGADELVLLDITATLENRDTIISVVRRVAREIRIPFTVGGGIRELADIRRLLAAGADKISLGSAAVSRPELIREAAAEFGSERIVLAIDAIPRPGGSYEVVTAGGTKKSGLDVVDWARRGAELGAGELLVTAFDRDGTKAGYDNVLNRRITDAVDLPLIASGGAGTLAHFRDAIVEGGADAVLAASLFHFGEITIGELKRYLASSGIPVHERF